MKLDLLGDRQRTHYCGELRAEHYENKTAADPRIDALRARMVVSEDKRYSREYLEPDKRSIANAVQVFFKNGEHTDKVEVEYPVGHRRRRAEGVPLLVKKARENLGTQFNPAQTERIIALCQNAAVLENLPVSEFVNYFVESKS